MSSVDAPAIPSQITEIEIEDFVKDMTEDDSCHCEYEHTISACSGEVTHKLMNCVAHVLVCFNAAQIKSKEITEREVLGHVCNECKRNIVNCWKVIPV